MMRVRDLIRSFVGFRGRDFDFRPHAYQGVRSNHLSYRPILVDVSALRLTSYPTLVKNLVEPSGIER